MSRRRLVLLAAALAAVALLSRLPFVTHVLWQWDSVLYARAIEEGFHADAQLRDARPHPPGYLFYVALAALFRLVVADSNAAFVAASLLGTALAVGGVFLVAARLAGPGPAAVAAAGFAFNPLVWLYGEIAYPYAILGFLSVALAGLFREARAHSGGARLAASILFGLAAGFRQDALAFLLPLWLWTMWPSPWRERLAAAAALGAGCLAWFVPSALLSGGVGAYVESVLKQATGVGAAYAAAADNLPWLTYNLRFTLYALAWGLLAFGVLLAGLALAPALRWLRSRRPLPRLRTDHVFFLLWIVPPLLFYASVYLGEWGYVLSILPGLYVLTAALLPPLTRQLRGAARLAYRLLATALVALPALAFLAAPDARFSAGALADHDRAVSAKVAYVRERFPADSTIVLAREDYLHVRYYLGEYRTWYYDPDPRAKQLTLQRESPARTTTVVLFTTGLQAPRAQDVRVAEFAPDARLSYFVLEAGAVFEFTGERFGVREGATR